MKQLKFKKGDKVRVIANHNGHKFKDGETIEIVTEFKDAIHPHYYAKNEKGRTSYVADSELIRINNSTK